MGTFRFADIAETDRRRAVDARAERAYIRRPMTSETHRAGGRRISDPGSTGARAVSIRPISAKDCADVVIRPCRC